MFTVLISVFMSSSAEVGRMLADHGHRQWAARVHELADDPRLIEFRDTLLQVAADGSVLHEEVNRFKNNGAATIGLPAYLRAIDAADEEIDNCLHAAWIVATLAVVGWERVMGDRLYVRPELGTNGYAMWSRLPFAYARIALRFGDVVIAGQLLDKASQALMLTATRYGMVAELRDTLQRHSALIQKVATAEEAAVANLAEALRDACDVRTPSNFRAEVSALLWALGYLPESMALRDGAAPPSRRLCRTLVRESVRQGGNDPLVQYLWLSMKDRGPFQVRAHEELFGLLNMRYPPLGVWAAGREQDLKLFVRVLVGWFACALDHADGVAFIHLCQMMVERLRHLTGQEEIIRVLSLRNYLVERAAYQDMAALSGWGLDWADLARTALGLAQRAAQAFELDSSAGKLGVPFFHLIDNIMPGPEAGPVAEDVLGLLEGLRRAPYAHLLTCHPAILPRIPEEKARKLRRRRADVLDHLRTAYGLMLMPTLPWHYHEAGMVLDEMREPPKPMAAYHQQAQELYAAKLAELRNIDQQLGCTPVDPPGTGGRDDAAPTLAALRTALISHTADSDGLRRNV